MASYLLAAGLVSWCFVKASLSSPFVVVWFVVLVLLLVEAAVADVVSFVVVWMTDPSTALCLLQSLLDHYLFCRLQMIET